MYLTNQQTAAKDMIKKQGEFAFQHTNNNTFFKFNFYISKNDILEIYLINTY
jgi:hypothetical protein